MERKIKFKKDKMYLIVWMDAYHKENCAWDDFKEVEKFVNDKGFIAFNLGWIIHEDKGMVTIASMMADNGKAVCHMERIPKGTIIKRRLLK